MTSPSSISTKSLLREARESLDAGDLDATLSTCRKLLLADRSNYQAYVLVGVAASRKGEVPRAVQAYERAIAIKPDAPLAYKGLADALTGDNCKSFEWQLRRARALLSLASHSPQHARKAAREGAFAIRSLANTTPTLIPEAVGAWRNLQALEASEGDVVDDLPSLLPEDASHFACVIVCMIADGSDLVNSDNITACSDHLFCQALDELESLRTPIGVKACDLRAQQLLVSRLLAGIRSRSRPLYESVEILKSFREYDAIFELCEEDKFLCIANYVNLLDLASTSFHFSPFSSPMSRSVSVFTLVHFLETGDTEKAMKMIDAESKPVRAGTSVITVVNAVADKCETTASNPYHLLSKFQLHYANLEYARAAVVASEGIRVCEELQCRDSMRATFHVLIGYAFKTCGKYNRAAEFYENAFHILDTLCADSSSREHILHTCYRGLLLTISAWKGMWSDRGRNAIERARNSENPRIVELAEMENIWVESLYGHGDVKAMEEVVSNIVKRSQKDADCQHRSQRLSLVQVMLNDAIIGNEGELAASGLVHLAQMYLTSSCPYRFERVKTLLMQAAGLNKNSADPFAFLGILFQAQAYTTNTPSNSMLDRAIRCYKKCLALDPAHPWGSRCLVRLLESHGSNQDAAVIAKLVTGRYLRAAWAWNFVGWSRYRAKMYSEAAIAFQSAIRANQKEDDLVFTLLLQILPEEHRETSLQIHVDSWRGLSLVYQEQGRLLPAVSCLNSALDATDPHKMNISGGQWEFEWVDRQRIILHTSKAAILTSLGKSNDALETLESVLGQAQERVATYLSGSIVDEAEDVMHAVVCYNKAEAYLSLASEFWNCGWFCRATLFRRKAVTFFAHCASIADAVSPLPREAIYARIGDAYRIAATYTPESLESMLSRYEVEQFVRNSADAYSKAAHYAPWNSGPHCVSCGVSMTLLARLRKSADLARLASQVIGNAGGDFLTLGASLAVLGDLEHSANIVQVGLGFLERDCGTLDRNNKNNSFGIKAVIASIRADLRAKNNGGDWAVAALRDDPSDWRAWQALGEVRQAEGEQQEWPWMAITSTVEAFQEADRLGAGPDVSFKLARCLERRSNALSNLNRMEEAGQDAAHANAMYARTGALLSENCQKVFLSSLSNKQSVHIDNNLENSNDVNQVSRILHWYPYAKHIVDVMRANIDRVRNNK